MDTEVTHSLKNRSGRYLSSKEGSSSLKLFSITCLSIATVFLALGSVFAAESANQQNLKILVFGATGKIGTHLVNEALNRGHIVTAVSRDPKRVTKVHENLSAVQGNVLDPENVAKLAVGQDVILISVRGVVGKSKDPHSTVQFIAVENVVNVLRDFEGKPPRLIHVGGAGSLEVKPGVVYADKLPRIFLPKKLEMEIAGQVLTLQYLRTVNDVNWSYATPPKNFTNGKRTGVFRIGGDQLLEDKYGRSRVSRADFAVAVIDEAEQAEHVNQRFSVVY